MQDTLKLWKDIKQGKYDVYLSYRTIEEVDKCPQPKRDIMRNFLAQTEYTLLLGSDEVDNVVQRILDMKILSSKSYDDCIHIAVAVVNECSVIVS